MAEDKPFKTADWINLNPDELDKFIKQQLRTDLNRLGLPQQKPQTLPQLFSVATKDLNLQGGVNPFQAAWDAARAEKQRRFKAGEPITTAQDRAMDFADRAVEWDAMQQGNLLPGRIGGVRPVQQSIQLNNPLVQSFPPSNKAPNKPFDPLAVWMVTDPNGVITPNFSDLNPKGFAKLLGGAKQQIKAAPEVFGQFLNQTRQGLSKAADVVAPWRHNVPDEMLGALESPDFEKVLRERSYLGFTGNYPALGGLTEKQTNWLLDPRRTGAGAPSAYGVVAIPTGKDVVFKYQNSMDPSRLAFYENEANMIARTAELGLGPKIHNAILKEAENPNLALTLQKNPPSPNIQAVFVNEKIPHTRTEKLNLLEQQYRDLESHKLTEDLMRGGIFNSDNHGGNVVIDKRTGKPMQLDSGLARDYNPTSIQDLNFRLLNLKQGFQAAGLRELAEDTDFAGKGILEQLMLNPSDKELYADMENFFNRSGNLLKEQKIDLPFFNQIKPPTPTEVAGEGLKRTATGAVVGSAASLMNQDVARAVEANRYDQAAAALAKDIAGGALAEAGLRVAAPAVRNALPRTVATVAPVVAPVMRVAGPAAVGAGIFMEGRPGSLTDVVTRKIYKNHIPGTPALGPTNPKTDIGARAGRAIGNEAKYIWGQILRGRLPYSR